MDEQRYWAFRVRSTPDAILRKLTSLVTANGLRDRIPSYCLEKLVHKRGQYEFFLFLSIVADEESYIPQGIKEILSYAGISDLVADYPLTYSEIKPITRPEAELQLGTYARQIEYHPPQMDRPDNPFDFAMASELEDSSSEAINQLLYWMSAVGKGTWQTFREACKSLELSDVAESRHIFRRLRLLGHVEYLNEGTHWVICPTCLVIIAADHKAKYFLSGAQVPSLIAKFQDTADSELEIKGNHGGPASVFITFKSAPNIQNHLNLLQNSYPHLRYAEAAGTKLADLLPDLNRWNREMLTPVGVASDRYALGRWDGEDFDIPVTQDIEAGMYRLTDLTSQESDFHYYFYFDSDRNCWLQGDWYGLRFLANYHLDILAEFQYESNLQQLFVPSIYHLPDLYERAAVLASGKLPSPVPGGLVYENVDASLAETISSKLYAQLIKGD